MPKITAKGPLTASSPELLNAIKNYATTDYQSFVPYATPGGENLRTIGNVILQSPAIQNEFINTLLNRIALVEITSRFYRNPLGVLKKGVLDTGETVEEIFVNISNAHQYNPLKAESEVFKREIPDVRAAFHLINSKVFYKQSIQRDSLRAAFTSFDGINRLTDGIIESMYTSAYNDEFLAMKYLFARHILDGNIAGVGVPALSDKASYETALVALRSTTNKFQILNPNYNMAKVWNSTPTNDMYIVMNADFEAAVGVKVLAAAFNMTEANYLGNRLLIDSFGALYNDRLSDLFADDPAYVEITEQQMEALDEIPCITIDRQFAQIFDQIFEMNDIYNPQGLAWNYTLHKWSIYSASPFAQAALYVPGVQGVTSVTVSPATVTTGKGQKLAFSANVVTTNFASKAVTWSTDSDTSTIDGSGIVTIPADEAGESIAVTATSVFDDTKYDTATITIA